MKMAVTLSLLLVAPLVLKAQNVVESQSLPENLASPQQVYVVQNAPTAQSIQQQQPVQQQMVIRTQPVTVIEDTPLRESKADQLRKSRIEIEQATESRIVERLEEERMKAERERAEKLMQGLEGQSQQQTVVAPAPPAYYPPAQYPPQQPPAVIVEPSPPIVISERAANLIKAEVIEEVRTKFYIQGLGGYGDYPGIKNIKGMYAAGFGVGVIFPERVVVEGSMIFSEYKIEEMYYGAMYPVIKEMSQINYMGAVKYQIVRGRLSPTIGMLMGYTSRTYSDKQYYMHNRTIESNAFDMGFSGGLDIELSRTFALTADFKYMFNLSYDIEVPYEESFVYPQNGKSPEDIDYYMFGVGARIQF